MLSFFLLLLIAAQMATVSSQAVPYDNSRGRNVTAVEDRFQRFQLAKAKNAGPEELSEICGKINENFRYKAKFGRSDVQDNLACNSLCCLGGYKVGNCGSEYEHYGVKVDFQKILREMMVGGYSMDKLQQVVKSSVTPAVDGKCFCSNDPFDVKCGRDGSYLNIRCPDRSACWRKCCREGKSGGKCTGFLLLECECY